MKLLVVSNFFAVHRGGVEVFARALSREFADAGHEVVWAAGETSPDPGPGGGVRIVSFPILNFVEDRTGIPFPIPLLGSLRAVLREVRKSEVLILQDCLYIANIFAFFAAKRYGIPIVIVQHTRYFPDVSRLLNVSMKIATSCVTYPMLVRSDQVIFVGKTTMESYQHLHFKRPPEWIYNGVDTSLFRPRNEKETIKSLREKHGLPQDRRVIFFVGRFIEKKGLLAIKNMAIARPDYFWVLAGRGPIDPDSWGLGNVMALSGPDDACVAELYRCCDLFLLPSSGEGAFPAVLREALVSDLTVICGEETLAADPEAAELVTGAPVFVGDHVRTAEVFLPVIDAALLSSVESDSRPGEHGTVARSRMSWKQVAQRHLQVISRVLSASEAGVPRMQEVVGVGRR